MAVCLCVLGALYLPVHQRVGIIGTSVERRHKHHLAVRLPVSQVRIGLLRAAPVLAKVLVQGAVLRSNRRRRLRGGGLAEGGHRRHGQGHARRAEAHGGGGAAA